MAYKEILCSKEGPVCFLTLNNSEKINALSKQMVGEITSALTDVSTDESVKVVVIKAAGKHFCSGHYLKEMAGAGAKENNDIFDNCTGMMRLMHEIPQPVITQVQGIATAAGCQLVAWSDLTLAEENARFATPGAAIVRAVGRKRALEMLLPGRYFSAQEAKEMGLINRIVPRDDLVNHREQNIHSPLS